MKSLQKNKIEYRQLKLRLAKIKTSFENLAEKNYERNLNLLIEQCHKCLQKSAGFNFAELDCEINELLGLAYAERAEDSVEISRINARRYLEGSIARGKIISLKEMSEKLADFARLCLQKIAERDNTGQEENSVNKYAAFANERALRHFKFAAQLLEKANETNLLPPVHFQILNCYNRSDAIRLSLGEIMPTRVEERILQAQKAREYFLPFGNTRQLAEIEATLGNLLIMRERGNRYENRKFAFDFWLNAVENEAVKDDPEFAGLRQTMEIYFPEYAQPEKPGETAKSTVQQLTEFNLKEEPASLLKNLASIHHYYLSFLPKTVDESEIDSYRGLWRDIWQDISEQSPQLKETALFFTEFEKDFVSVVTEICTSFPNEELEICAPALENQRFINFGKIVRRKKPNFIDKYEAELKYILEFLLSLKEKSKGDGLLEIESHLVISAIYAFLANFTDERTSLQHKQAAREHFEVVMQNRREEPFYSSGIFYDLQLTLVFQRLYRLSSSGSESPEVFQALTVFNEGSLKIWVDAYEQEYRKSITEGGKHEILRRLSSGSFSIVLQYAYVLARGNKLLEAVLFLEKWRGRQFADSLQISADELKLIRETERLDYLSTIKKIDSLKAEERSLEGRERSLIFEDLNESYLVLERVIRRIKSYQPDFLREPEFADIQKNASDKHPLLYLLTTVQGTVALLVPGAGMPRCRSIDDFNQANLSLLIKKLENSDLTKYDVLLGEKLVKPVIEFLLEEEVEAVHLIPCGALAVLPLHTTATPQSECLIDHFDVYFAPTAYVLSSVKDSLATKQFEVENFLAVSDTRNDLTFANIETQIIASFFKPPQSANVGAGEKATLNWLKAALSEKNKTYIHFAGHGQFRLENPLDSCLLMARQQELTLREILNNDDYEAIGSARLLVLSACRTALIDHLKLPEEAFGIAAGFLQTGVSGVVATLWNVDDFSVAILMIKFYENLIIDRRNPAAALRQAQLWLRRASSADLDDFYCKYARLTARANQSESREADFNFEETSREQSSCYADPHHWAAFVLTGI